MSFAFPLAAALAALGAVIVYLYMRRPQRRDLPVPSLLFWDAQNRKPSTSRQSLGRITNWLSLLLILASLILLVGALMRPRLGNLLLPDHTVIILDARLRMQASTPGGRTAFDEALAVATGIADQARPGHQVAILKLGATPQTLSPFSTNPQRLLEVLDMQNPTDGAGDLAAAIQLATQTLSTNPAESDRRISIITDRKADALNPPDTTWHLVGAPQDNIAITEFGTRSAPGLSGAQEVSLRVQNFASEAREVEIDLQLDGKLIDVVPLQLGPGEGAGRTLSVNVPSDPAADGHLTATLRSSDALTADNTRRAILQDPEKPRVLLVTDSNWFLERAISADDSVAFELLNPEFWRDSMAAAFDVVVFDHFVPSGIFPSAFNDGKFVFFGLSPWSATENQSGSFPITDTKLDEPLLRNVELTSVRVAEVTSPSESTPGAVKTLAASGDLPVITAWTNEAGEVAAYAFHFPIDASDLPLRAAFPILIANAIQSLAPQPDDTPLRVGETIPNPDAGFTTFDRAGFFELGPQPVAVNPHVYDESDLRANSNNQADPTTGGVPNISLSWWQLLALAAILLLVAEATLYPKFRSPGKNH